MRKYQTHLRECPIAVFENFNQGGETERDNNFSSK
jgi:hypothetical protein